MKRMKKILALVLATVMITALFAGCAAQPKEKPFKVGFIYIGATSDKGWSYAHNEGRKAMMANLGMSEEDAPYIETVPENADAATAIETLVKKGCNLIFTTSFGYMDYTLAIAEKYPDVKFMHCSGYKTSENMGNYFGRIYQARYLAGMAAGAATKTNQIGYVGAFDIPEVVRGINAFTLGVRAVNPEATVKVVWTKTWYDPAVEKEAAESLIAAGVDVMAQHQDTFEPVAAAEKAGIFSTGYHNSMAEFAPKGYLTSPIWNFGDFYTEQAKAVKEGTWTPVSYWEGLSAGVVELDAFGPSVSEETKALIKEKQDLIASGAWDVFNGPIKDQDGQVRVPEGSNLSDEEKLSFDWFVEGVDGRIGE